MITLMKQFSALKLLYRVGRVTFPLLTALILSGEFALAQQPQNDIVYVYLVNENLDEVFQNVSEILESYNVILKDAHEGYIVSPILVKRDRILDLGVDTISVWKESSFFNAAPVFPVHDDFGYEAFFELSRNSVEAIAKYVAAIGLYDLGKCQDAVELFEEVENEVETIYYKFTFANIAFYQGVCALENSDYELGIAYLRQATALYRNHDNPFFSVTTAFNLAWAYLQIGAKEKANQVLDNIPPDLINFDIWNGRVYRAQLYALEGRYDDAIADLTGAIELPSDDTPILFILRGQMYLALYEWDSALADYNTAIELDPDYADAYYERGVLYYSILQTGVELRADALADFRHYLELAPDGDHAEDAARYVEQIEAELAALNE